MPKQLPKSIDHEFKEFLDQYYNISHLSKEEKIHQITEMRKVFFAGAVMMHAAIGIIGEPHISEETALKWLDDITDEISKFSFEISHKANETN